MISNARRRMPASGGCVVALPALICRPARILAYSLSLVALTGLLAQADAAVCKYVARDGRITYSNLAGPPGASKVECFQASAPISASPAVPGTADTERTGTVPDTGGRSALEQQLADEEERLERAQRALSDQEANLGGEGAPYYYGWLGPYADAVRTHRRERDRIRRQLAEHGWDRESSHDARPGTAATRSPLDAPDSPDSKHGWPTLGSATRAPEHNPEAGFGRQSGGRTGSHAEPESGRR
jgi:hypothetical protein